MTRSWNKKQQGYIMRCRALLMLILHRLSEIIIYEVDKSTEDFRINKTTSFIAMNYSDKLTVKGLAELVRLNEVYFGSLFKKQTGKTVHQYITQIRVRNAENLLQSGNYKVQEVAEMCGFSDVFHFYNSFRSIRGFAPSRCIPRKNSAYARETDAE
jgi:YesN/AraC family two-component response regulator